jgi:BirA family transcriptional regulator, biotin operon repressor / biotin---[acetyl-CoA-carboxylase] ligase
MIGRPRVHHRTTDSTNERAKQLALAGAPHGTLVTAGEQSAGRGRQGRTWFAPPGRAVLMSVLLRDLGAAQGHLPLAAALAVCDACEQSAPVRCSIKWPNDVWIDGLKVAGILIEGRPQEGWMVLGIGLNVATAPEEFDEEIREIATSLVASARDADAPTVENVLQMVVQSLAVWLEREPSEITSAWRKRDALLGQRIRWQQGEGTAEGVDESGALLVMTDAGRVALDAGEVHLSR